MNMIKELLFGKNPVLSGVIALLVISGIVLGCTCNDKDGFQWKNSESSSDTSEAGDEGNDAPKRKADASKGEIPGEDELEEMVKKTLLDFDRALKDEDFGDFYDSISKAWQKETSPRRLKRLFQKFIDGDADLSSIRNMEPEFSSDPAIKESVGYEMLEVNGKFDTVPTETTFELKYLPEGKEYKLAAISVYTGLRRPQ